MARGLYLVVYTLFSLEFEAKVTEINLLMLPLIYIKPTFYTSWCVILFI